MPSTVQFQRVLRTTPERLYRAFLDPDAMVKWLPPNGFTGKVHDMDARVGGKYKMSFTNFSSGKSHSFGGEYLELVPNERLRYIDRFDDPDLPGEMKVTVTLKKVLVGTEMNIVQEGIPDAFRRRRATLAGRNRWRCWRCSSRRRFLISAFPGRRRRRPPRRRSPRLHVGGVRREPSGAEHVYPPPASGRAHGVD